MSALIGVFEQFNNLDKISLENIRQWLKNKVQIQTIHNFLANRLLYPQTVPVSQQEMEIDLAILQQAIRSQPSYVYNKLTNKLTLPAELINRFSPLSKLGMALAAVLDLTGVTPVLFQGRATPAGSIVTVKTGGLVSVSINGQVKKVLVKTMTYFPITERHIKLKVSSAAAIDVPGGEFGLLLHLP